MNDTIQKIADEMERAARHAEKFGGNLSFEYVAEWGERLRALSARASAGEGVPVLWVSRDALQQATACANADRPTVATVNAWNDPQRLTGHDPIALYTAAPQPAQSGASGGGEFIDEWERRFGFLATQNDPRSIESIDEVACLLTDKPTPASPATGDIEPDAIVSTDREGDMFIDVRSVTLKHGDKLYRHPPTPQPAAAQGVPTWFVSRCPGYPGGIDFRSKADALDLIRHHGNDETALHYWLHQAGRVDYTPEQTRAMLAAAPQPQDK